MLFKNKTPVLSTESAVLLVLLLGSVRVHLYPAAVNDRLGTVDTGAAAAGAGAAPAPAAATATAAAAATAAAD